MPRSQVATRRTDYGLLALFVALTYWPLSSFHHITRWDSLEGYFPLRYFLSDCIRHGILPLWNPYQLGGYPFYGDPQSGFWYPFAWLFGSLAPYGFWLFTLEHLFTFVMAALGMYELTRSLVPGRVPALIAGISYAACGFFVGNAEHLTWLISAAWLPWVLWSYRRMLHHGEAGHALLLAVFLYLLLSGGYPAFFIVTAYLLLLLFACWLTAHFRSRHLRRGMWLHALCALVFAVLSAGLIVSWWQALPHTTRSGAMSPSQFNLYPFPPRALISLLTPFTTLKDDVFFATDIVMRNAYMGLLCLLALPFAWPALKRRRLMLLIAVLTLLSLAVSFGDALPLRAWLARALPLMDRFRFPALFRLFFIVGLLLIAAQGIACLVEDFHARKRKPAVSIAALMLVFAGLLGYSVARHGWHWHWGFLASHFESYQYQSTRDENLQLQAIAQLILLGILLLLCLYRGGRYLRPGVLVLFCAADMTLALSMNAFTTIVNEERAPNIEKRIADAPHDFQVPDDSLPVRAWSDERRALGELRTNTGIYFKTPQADGYNSFLLQNFADMEASAIMDSVMANPVCYFASGLSNAGPKHPPAQRAELRVNDSVFSRLGSMAATRKSGITLLRFEPGNILMRVEASDPALLCLQQNSFPGWSLRMDGRPASIIRTNYAQMGAVVPLGTHTLSWCFAPRGIRPLLALCFAGFVLVVAGLVVFRKRLFASLTAG